MFRTVAPLLSLALIPLVGTADAGGRPNLTSTVTLNATEIPLGDSARFATEVCNTGSGNANNAYMSTMLPSGVSYGIARTPRGGSCRAIRYGSQAYIYCMVTIRAGACVTLDLSVTPGAVGDYTFTGVADGNNLIRETDETDNTASVDLTVY